MSDASPSSLTRRLREGLERIGAALRAEQWDVAGAFGLNPTQIHVLTFIAGRGERGLRVREVAEHLGVTQPTATDSISALVRKGLLTKAASPDDARATALRITQTGRDIVRGVGLAVTATERALDTLSQKEQVALLRIVIKTIRALQIAGAIPVQRMCVTCRHFHPNAHAGEAAQHFCSYVGAAFGESALRLDCPEHDASAPQDETENRWTAYAQSEPV
jgi:DNA-binding MarR family transcriptional regulator